MKDLLEDLLYYAFLVIALITIVLYLILLGRILFGSVGECQPKNDCYCRVGDRTIQVKEYTKIKEEE